LRLRRALEELGPATGTMGSRCASRLRRR
jgi:hypothetical protein